MFSDRAGELDERFQPRAGRPGEPRVEALAGFVFGEPVDVAQLAVEQERAAPAAPSYASPTRRGADATAPPRSTAETPPGAKDYAAADAPTSNPDRPVDGRGSRLSRVTWRGSDVSRGRPAWDTTNPPAGARPHPDPVSATSVVSQSSHPERPGVPHQTPANPRKARGHGTSGTGVRINQKPYALAWGKTRTLVPGVPGVPSEGGACAPQACAFRVAKTRWTG